jgi:serine/threonine protein kinase
MRRAVQTGSEQTRDRTSESHEAAREKTCWQCGHTLITEELFCPRDGARLIDIALREDHDPLIGQLIDGRYLVHGRVGEGGMGMVYRATSKEDGQDVAIKVLKADYLRDGQIRRRFMHEARIVANLEHPQAVRLHDFGQMPDGNFFMVMELLEGESLAERLTYKFLTWREVFDIIAPICRVLGEAHRKGVVHRDLKPENIYIARDGRGGEVPKLIDFGVARQLDQATITHAGAMWGTPAYMSPEQARGERVEAGADNYAIGIILYELICGTLPFNASSQMGYAVKHMHEPARSLTTMPGLESPPTELDALILSLLEKDPALRPGPADFIADQLDHIRARWFDDDLLALTPAMEIDPVALQSWLKDSVVDASASMERPAFAALPATPPPGALGLEVSRTYEDLAIAHLPTITPAEQAKHVAAPPRPRRTNRLTVIITACAVLVGGIALWAILTRPDASPALAASVQRAEEESIEEQPIEQPIAPPIAPPIAKPQPPQPSEPLMDEATQDALSRGGARAAQTVMHARTMATPEAAPQIRTVIRRIRVKSRDTLSTTDAKKAEPSIRDAIKKTF